MKDNCKIHKQKCKGVNNHNKNSGISSELLNDMQAYTDTLACKHIHCSP